MKRKEHYNIVLTDITNEEIYQKKLEYLSVTDTLTNIKNRRYFQEKLREEVSRANRYTYPSCFNYAWISDPF